MMRVEQIRKSLPKTMDALQTRIGRIGSGVADRFQTVARSDTVARARKAVRRGSEETMKWVRRNPRALPLAGMGLGGALATWLLVRARRNAHRPKLVQKALKTVGSLPGVRQGLASSFVRFLGWAMTPRKPHVFRAISIRW
jgi:hypothetical protein